MSQEKVMGHQRGDERRDFKQKLYEAEGAKQYREANMRIQMGGWMDDLRFYVPFNSISVISGRWADDNGRLHAMEPRLQLIRFCL